MNLHSKNELKIKNVFRFQGIFMNYFNNLGENSLKFIQKAIMSIAWNLTSVFSPHTGLWSLIHSRKQSLITYHRTHSRDTLRKGIHELESSRTNTRTRAAISNTNGWRDEKKKNNVRTDLCIETTLYMLVRYEQRNVVNVLIHNTSDLSEKERKINRKFSTNR